MGKKMKLPNFLSNIAPANADSRSLWPWPTYCHQPKTLSFRAGHENMLKTINSTYLDAATIVTDQHESLSTNSPESTSFCTETDESGVELIETVIRGVRSSERLFFEPEETNSILEEAKAGGFPFQETVVMSMESKDPYVDFKNSMEEMVKAYELKGWEDLEDLLFSYLKVNGKSNHGYIIGAFVDLLVGTAFAYSSIESSSGSQSPSSPLSFYTSSSSSDSSTTTPCVSPLDAEEKEINSNDHRLSPCLSSSEVQSGIETI
ncbi:hypothetical protein K2173_012150 [Erythroxylum novogranatense]|uniref:Transcription repressor n=1 Tax=Erythroxylum novogranatense TaxID=1862640 RepID=A0AAV8SR72_9ROSI|nr:hypothetical protein K2173_012150 [Erythroxylum novogranatense]